MAYRLALPETGGVAEALIEQLGGVDHLLGSTLPLELGHRTQDEADEEIVSISTKLRGDQAENLGKVYVRTGAAPAIDPDATIFTVKNFSLDTGEAEAARLRLTDTAEKTHTVEDPAQLRRILADLVVFFFVHLIREGKLECGEEAPTLPEAIQHHVSGSVDRLFREVWRKEQAEFLAETIADAFREIPKDEYETIRTERKVTRSFSPEEIGLGNLLEGKELAASLRDSLEARWQFLRWLDRTDNMMTFYCELAPSAHDVKVTVHLERFSAQRQRKAVEQEADSAAEARHIVDYSDLEARLSPGTHLVAGGRETIDSGLPNLPNLSEFSLDSSEVPALIAEVEDDDHITAEVPLSEALPSTPTPPARPTGRDFEHVVEGSTQTFAWTSRGGRATNQDGYAFNVQEGWWALADGMGGLGSGEHASALLLYAIALSADRSHLERVVLDEVTPMFDERLHPTSKGGSTILLTQKLATHDDGSTDLLLQHEGDSEVLVLDISNRRFLYAGVVDNTTQCILEENGLVGLEKVRGYKERVDSKIGGEPPDEALLTQELPRLSIGMQINSTLTRVVQKGSPLDTSHRKVLRGCPPGTVVLKGSDGLFGLFSLYELMEIFTQNDFLAACHLVQSEGEKRVNSGGVVVLQKKPGKVPTTFQVAGTNDNESFLGIQFGSPVEA